MGAIQIIAKHTRAIAQRPHRARWAAPVLGIMAAFGFQPLALWPLTLLGLAGLIALIAEAPDRRQAALLGWLFGLGHFTLGNNWIATAFTYQSDMPAWLGWVAVLGLAMFLAIYPMLAMLAAWLVGRRNTMALVLACAGFWIVTEWLRAWVFTGYAWNPLAVTALGGFSRPGLAAVAPLLGTYGLSGLVVLLSACWFIAANRRRADLAGAALLLGPAVLFLLPLHGSADLGHIPYTLVQPDVRQEDLANPALYETHFAVTAALSLPVAARQPSPAAPRLVLWPESGLPDYLRDGYPDYLYRQETYAADPQIARARIGRVIGADGLLLTGAVDLELRHGKAIAARNVITALDGAGRIRGSYAKAHLVPGGEYLPMREILGPLGLTRLVAGSLDFWPGPGPRTLDFGPWGKAGMQICYEIVFSGEVTDRAHRPDYIFNPSNDGWFGSFGPPQHLAQARLRAIEEGLPVLRATTTGISAVIDADGVVRQFIPRHRSARIDGMIPPAHGATLFARLGNMLPLGWAAILLVLCLVALRRSGS